MEPFSIPQRMLKDASKQVPPLQVGRVAKRIEQKQLSFDGESLDVWAVEGTDPQGGPMSAMVSLDVAPIGVLLADTDEMSMYLEAWGGGATTRIKGKPIGLSYADGRDSARLGDAGDHSATATQTALDDGARGGGQRHPDSGFAASRLRHQPPAN